MGGFPPARGNGSPIAGLLGGLGGLMQGFMQGRQMRDQEQINQEQLQGDRLKNSLSVFDVLSKIGQADPNALNSPQLAAFAKQSMGQGGIPLPTSAQGGIDANAFRTPLTALTQNSSEYDHFLSMPSGSPQRAQQLAGFGGTDEQKAQLLNLPQQVSATAQASLAGRLDYLAQMAATGMVDPNSPTFQAQYNAIAQVAQLPPWQGVTPGAKTTAQISNLNAGTQQKNASAQQTQANTALLKLKAKYFPLVQSATIAHLQALTGLAGEQMKAIPQRVAIAWQNANTAVQRANDSHTKLQMEVQSFQKLGTTPAALSAYNGLMNSFQTQSNQDRMAADAAQKNVELIVSMNNNQVPDSNNPGLLKIYQDAQAKFQHLNKRYNGDLDQLKQFGTNRSAFTKAVQQKLGAPPSWHPTNNGAPSKPSGKPVATLHGKPIFLNKDGSGYVYADGSVAK